MNFMKSGMEENNESREFMEKLRDIKCILLDIDGTLTNANLEISDTTMNVIKKAKKVEF